MDMARLWGVAFLALTTICGCTPREDHPADTTVRYSSDGVEFESLAFGPVVSDRNSTGGVSVVDYDGDGLLDLVIGNWPNSPGPEEENLVLINHSTGGYWLRVKLTGTTSNTSGIGARIEVTDERLQPAGTRCSRCNWRVMPLLRAG